MNIPGNLSLSILWIFCQSYRHFVNTLTFQAESEHSRKPVVLTGACEMSMAPRADTHTDPGRENHDRQTAPHAGTHTDTHAREPRPLDRPLHSNIPGPDTEINTDTEINRHPASRMSTRSAPPPHSNKTSCLCRALDTGNKNSTSPSSRRKIYSFWSLGGVGILVAGLQKKKDFSSGAWGGVQILGAELQKKKSFQFKGSHHIITPPRVWIPPRVWTPPRV